MIESICIREMQQHVDAAEVVVGRTIRIDHRGAVLEPVAVVTRFQNMAVMRESVQQCRGHLVISEHAGPLTEAQVGGDHDARALVQLGQQVEQQSSS